VGALLLVTSYLWTLMSLRWFTLVSLVHARVSICCAVDDGGGRRVVVVVFFFSPKVFWFAMWRTSSPWLPSQPLVPTS
jgi:hypothetical protein